MKVTIYVLSNKSGSVGQYLYNEEWYNLNPSESVQLEKKPTTKTANLTLSYFRKEIVEKKKATTSTKGEE